MACPGALFALETSPRITGPRQGLRLFAKDPVGVGSAWRAIPLQVDPIDGDGHLVFFEDSSYMNRAVDAYDYLNFRVEDFGERFDPTKDKLPCAGSLVYEVKDDAGKRYAYLTNCGLVAAPVSHPFLVAFDKKNHRLESATYQYKFNPENYMQFSSIAFRGADGWDVVAEDSRMLIRADVKNFFTMNFDSRQIESHLEESRLGPVGDLARLSFYLRILFFKIDLRLSTDVGFFLDSGHIPMMVNIPVNAYEYLHPASGILYTWALSPAAEAGVKDVHMPLLDVDTVKKGYVELAKIGQRSCRKGDCEYRYTVDVRGRRLSMDLVVKKALVDRGFFPIYVDDVNKYKEAMGWELNVPKDVRRPGIYFEVSGLPKGGHPWDFWLKLGSPKDGASDCPVMVRVTKMK